VQWVNPTGDALLSAVRALRLPAGEGYAWAAGEARTMTAVRQVLVGELGIDGKRCRCAAYWKQGAVAHHENLQDTAA
jgi:NADPH-dependent ferric siderophore reductase